MADMNQIADLARKTVMAAETGSATTLLEQLMGRHRRSWQHTSEFCSLCNAHAPCDVFVLAASQLTLIELIDGTRFSAEWRGPVEDRNY